MEIVFVVIGVVVAVFGLTVLRGAPYVPTHRSALRALFASTVRLNERDTVLDIGCGDGIVLREAARHGARAIGYEINPFLVVIARMASWRLRSRVSVYWADFWVKPFPKETTVVYTFGESRDIARMYRAAVQGARHVGHDITFISYGFRVHDEPPIAEAHGFFVYRITSLQPE